MVVEDEIQDTGERNQLTVTSAPVTVPVASPSQTLPAVIVAVDCANNSHM